MKKKRNKAKTKSSHASQSPDAAINTDIHRKTILTNETRPKILRAEIQPNSRYADTCGPNHT